MIILSLYCVILQACKQQGTAPGTCMENPGQGKLLVLIGEKISVTALPHEEGSLDGKFLARYKINELICGDYTKDTVSFIAYDHYGEPPFSNYKNAMLFLADDDSMIYHHKYQFFDVYKTKDGRWASSYKPDEYWRSDHVKPVPIEFAEEVSYNIIGGKKSLIRKYFPEPYFKLTKEKAIALWGNYVPELFQLKKDGVLKARGLFGDPDAPLKFEETPMAEIREEEPVPVSEKEKVKIKDTYYRLRDAVRSGNADQIKKMSLDSIYCSICEGIREDYYDNELDAINVYIDSAYRHFPNEEIWGPSDNKYKIQINAQKQDDNLTVYHLFYFEMIGKTRKDIVSRSHTFKFIKMNNDFKLYGMTSY